MSQVTQEPTRLAPRGAPTELQEAEAPVFERVSHAHISRVASELADKPIQPAQAPIMQLSARKPYDAARGRIDIYRPGRWDTSYDLIFMDAIRQVGPSVGEWEGSAAYVFFIPPAAGEYLIVGHFTGYQTTMHLNGPWGENTAYTAQTSDAGVVTALWSGDQEFEFTMHCKAPNNGWGIGYIESIQVYELS